MQVLPERGGRVFLRSFFAEIFNLPVLALLASV